MRRTKPSNFLEKILEISILLMFVSTFIVFVIGSSIRSISKEVKFLNGFILSSQDIQPNFERSLQLYTANTKEAISYVHSLRPATELDYIEFISLVEDIGQQLFLNINLQLIEDSGVATADRSKTLNYEISFFGSRGDMIDFLSELEALPYYIRVDEVKFQSLTSLFTSEERAFPNVNLTIQLYVK